MNKSQLLFYGAIHSFGVLAYVFLLVSFLNNAKKFFDKVPEILIGTLMLSLFVLSASVTSLLVLGRPIHLYFNGLKKEGLTLLFSTLACLFVLIALLIFILTLIK